MEPRFGRDFSDIRVHTDEGAEASARAIDAQAYTVGRDIVFGPGRYRPDPPSTRPCRLIAHELTHVVQQGRSGPSLQTLPTAPPRPPPPSARPGRSRSWSAPAHGATHRRQRGSRHDQARHRRRRRRRPGRRRGRGRQSAPQADGSAPWSAACWAASSAWWPATSRHLRRPRAQLH